MSAYVLDAETIGRMADLMGTALAGTSDNKGVATFFFPPEEECHDIDEAGLIVNFKIFIGWRAREVLFYTKSRKKPTVKATSSSCEGTVVKINHHMSGTLDICLSNGKTITIKPREAVE